MAQNFCEEWAKRCFEGIYNDEEKSLILERLFRLIENKLDDTLSPWGLDQCTYSKYLVNFTAYLIPEINKAAEQAAKDISEEKNV